MIGGVAKAALQPLRASAAVARRTVFCGQRSCIMSSVTPTTPTNPFLSEAQAQVYHQSHANPATACCEAAQKSALDLALQQLLPSGLQGLATATTAPRLLQVGSGAGFWTSYLDQRGFQVTAVEPSEAMLQLARARAYLHEVTFIQGTLDSAQGTLQPLRPFHAVAFMNCLEYIADPAETLKGAAGLLGTNGGLLLCLLLNAEADIATFGAVDSAAFGAGVRRFSEVEVRATLLAPLKEASSSSSSTEVVLYHCAFPETLQLLLGRHKDEACSNISVEEISCVERAQRALGRKNGRMIVAALKL